MPILSICIPTYNRAEYLKKVIDSIVNDETFLNTSDVELVISNNCSNDSTDDLCRMYKEKFPEKITYICQTEPIYSDEHIFKCTEYATGEYTKLNNDTLCFCKGAIKKIVELIKNNPNQEIFFLANGNGKKEGNYICNSFDELLQSASYNITWIGGMLVKRGKFNELEDYLRYRYLQLSQIDMYARFLAKGDTVFVCNDSGMFSGLTVKNKGGYNVAEIFGQNYLKILREYLDKSNGLTQKTYEVQKKEILKFVEEYYFDYNHKYNFKKTGYFKYIFNNYSKNFYFYWHILMVALKLILKTIMHIEKNENQKSLMIFNKLRIILKGRSTKNYRKLWRKQNKHNYTSLIRQPLHQRIKVGRYTYGEIDAQIDGDFGDLVIGDFCSIAHGVHFIVSSEHNYKGLSTYPFKVMMLGQNSEAVSKGDIIVKDDVWIGCGAIILSGVTIGQGAIVSAGSVVTKDVPPYAIVGGVPAKVLKYRFDSEIIDELVKFDYSKLTEEKVKLLGEKLYTKLTKENVKNILKEIEDKDV